MRIAIISVVAIVGFVVLVLLLIAVLGSLLPKEHSATRSVVLHKSPESVYGVARDFASTPKWRGDVREVKLTNDQNGRVRFREEGKHGTTNYELTEDVPA